MNIVSIFLSGLKIFISKNPWSDDNKNENNIFGDFMKYKGDKYGGMFPKKINKFLIFIILIIFTILYLLSGIYIVNPEEQGVQLFLGKYHKTTESGLHYKLPSPFASVRKVKSSLINREDINSIVNISTNYSKDSEILMLTGDENMINIDFSLQWKINDPYKFLYSVSDNPSYTIVSAIEGVMRDVISQSNISFLLTGEGRSFVTSRTISMLQDVLDSYSLGVDVVSVQLKSLDPPLKVISAFRDVQNARADKERVVNNAIAYQNEVIPNARGNAAQIIKKAEAYKQSLILLAQGDAERFSLIYNQYIYNPNVTKERIYINTMSDILSKSNVVFTTTNNILPFLNFDSGK